MIDTHTHIYMSEFDDDRDAVIQRAISANVNTMILPNVDIESIGPLHRCITQYASRCYAAMGLHPTSVTENYPAQLAAIRPLFDNYRYCAIGEIGMDLYWDKTFLREQSEAFATQITWSQQLSLPIIIHCREAFEETLQILSHFGHNSVRGVFHSFTGTPQQVERIRHEAGDFYFGINGIVTFKNAHLDDLVSAIGIERILLETDAPYLAPVPYRGHRNEPSYIPRMATRIADILGISFADVATTTADNARDLFNLPISSI